jgi:subtilisin family serine protease
MIRRQAGLLAAVFLSVTGGCVEAPTNLARDERATTSQLLRPKGGQQAYLGRYLIAFREDVTDVRGLAEQLARVHGGDIRHVYEYAVKGFSATLSDQAAEALRRNSQVAYVEENKPIVAVDHITQSNATWGLDRIDQRDLPLNGTYDYVASGSGVRVYIIDTGIRTTHSEFGGRGSIGVDERPEDGQAGQDCFGHGTAVSGIVGGATYGVAKSVSLIAVRVLGCFGQGSLDDLVAGLDWVTANRVTPAVANVSIAVVDGFGNETTSQMVDDAVNRMINASVTAAIAAGNTSKDACGVSPARVGAAITAGASNSLDSRSSFSNFGTCVDLFAPGEAVTTAYIGSDYATTTGSGTSFAAPHVAGVAALYLEGNSAATPSQVWSVISAHATTGKLSNIGTGSPNTVLHSIFMDVNITGPSFIMQSGVYTWTANPSGGDGGGYTYQWSVTWSSGYTSPLDTQQSQSLYIDHCSGSFVMRVTVRSLGSDAAALKGVFNCL